MNTEIRLIMAAAAGLLAGAGCAGSQGSSVDTASPIETPVATGTADPASAGSGEAHQCSADHNCNGKMKMDGSAQPSASVSSPAPKP